MTIGIIASIIAFFAYGGLLFLVYQEGLRGNKTLNFFSHYLLDMMFMQVSYLGISTASRSSTALFWYTLHVSLASAQAIIYFFFIRSFLGLQKSQKLLGISIAAWLFTLVNSIVFRSNLFIDIYRDPETGMFLPDIGAFAILLSIPTVLFLGATLFELSRHYDNQTRSQQARIQYLFLSIVLVWTGMATNIKPALQPYAIDVIANILSAILIAYAILRYDLLELNTVLRKGLEIVISILVYSAGSIIAIFLFTKLFRVDVSTRNLFFITLISVITLLILNPLRKRIQQFFGQTLFKTTYDGYAMIQRISRTATSILEIENLSTLFLGDVVNTLQAQWGVLLVRQKNDSYKIIASERITADFTASFDQNHVILNWISEKKTNNTVYSFSELPKHITLSAEMNNPSLTGSQLLPLKTRGKFIGVLWLGAKIKQRPYSQDDKTNLVTVANNIAATIDNALLYEALKNELKERKLAEQKVKETNQLLATQLKKIKILQENLKKQVVRDPLTGLFNRRYLYETFDREMARAKRKNYPISMILIDFDNFKEINDSYGHQVGDEVLKSLGSLFLNNTRQGDIACRYGGDEFLIIMPGIHGKDALQRAKTLQQKIENLQESADIQNVFITASMGIAFYPKHGDNLEDIIKASDDALYEAKNAGRNRISLNNQQRNDYLRDQRRKNG